MALFHSPRTGLENMKPSLSSSSKGLKQLNVFYSKLGLPEGPMHRALSEPMVAPVGLFSLSLMPVVSWVLLSTAPDSLPAAQLSVPGVSRAAPARGAGSPQTFPLPNRRFPYDACEGMQASWMGDSWVLSLKITNALGRGSISLTAGNFSIRSFHIYNKMNVLI